MASRTNSPFVSSCPIALAICLFWLAVAPATEIELRSQCACEGFVTLGDIAEIRGSNLTYTRQLAALPLVPAPAAGQMRLLRVREIQELMELRGVDLNSLQFLGASRVELTERAADAEAEDDVPTSVRFPLEQFAIVAARPLTRGDLIRAGDLELRELAVPQRITPSQLENVEQAMGLQLTRSVSAGQAVDKNVLRRPTLVRRGGSVTIYARAGGIQVSTLGRALDDGARDDVVMVELLDDRSKKISGRVIGTDEVEVLAQGLRVTPNN